MFKIVFAIFLLFAGEPSWAPPARRMSTFSEFRGTDVEYVAKRLEYSDELARQASEGADQFYQTPWAGRFRDEMVSLDLLRLERDKTVALLLGKSQTQRYTGYTEENAVRLLKSLIDKGYTVLYDFDSKLGMVLEGHKVPPGRAIALKSSYPTFGSGANGHKRVVIEDPWTRGHVYMRAKWVIASRDSDQQRIVLPSVITKWESFFFADDTFPSVKPQQWRPFNGASALEFFASISPKSRRRIIESIDEFVFGNGGKCEKKFR